MTSRVILLRHGQTSFNATGRFQGQEDVPLDDVGVVQAKRAAEALGASLAGSSVKIVSSDLSRAAATAAALGAVLSVPVSSDARLREIHAGKWQGMLRDEIKAGWPTEFAAWRAGDPDVRLGSDGETRREAATRCAEAIAEHASSTDGVLVCVGHGAALRGAILELIGAATLSVSAFEGLGNACWAVLSPSPSSAWRLAAYNVSA